MQVLNLLIYCAIRVSCTTAFCAETLVLLCTDSCCYHHLVSQDMDQHESHREQSLHSVSRVPASDVTTLVMPAGDNTPDAQIDLEGPPAAAFLSQGAPCSRTPGGETPTRSPDVTDQLKAATSPTAGHAQAPASSKPIDDGGKATDGLAAKQLKAAAASLMAGQPDEASDMPAVGQVQPADGLMGGQADSRAPPVILILCGVPGSGKSTFCAQLIAQGQTSWVRVNQDSINRGRQVLSADAKVCSMCSSWYSMLCSPRSLYLHCVSLRPVLQGICKSVGLIHAWCLLPAARLCPSRCYAGYVWLMTPRRPHYVDLGVAVTSQTVHLYKC